MDSAFATGDYYAILGVARGADERDVKRSYFRLVRQYNPENHPEEFKRIREAYEILSNATSRKDYDGLTQFGDEIGAHMKAGSEAMERADYRAAQAEFKHALVMQPQLAFARDLLGMAYLNGGQARDALVHFNLLVAQQPNNPVYHLHKGYAHYAQQQYAQAQVAYRRALELDPTDNRVRIALADCFTDTEQHELALAELDKAINQDGEVNFQDFVYLMRKVQVQLLRNRPDLAEGELDQVFKVLPPDGDSRKYVATRIGALAAQLFRMRRSADANRLLARARQLDSRKTYEHVWPAKATVAIRDLPPASQTTLASLKSSWTPTRLVHRALGGAVLLAAISGLFGAIGLLTTFASDTLWEETGMFFMLLLLVGAPLFFARAMRKIRRVKSSPYGKYTEVTPIYLLQVDIDKLTAWPLVNLHDVALTHHLQNGSYQNTSVRMDFGGVPLTLSIRGQQQAVDWAQHILDTRHRTLSLLADGLLDGEEALDLIPPAKLLGVEKPRPVPGAARNTVLTYVGTGLAGLAFFFGVATPLNRLNAERAGWHAATRFPTVASYRRYLEHYPDGRHASEAKEQIAEQYAAAKSFLLGNHLAGGGPALAGLIDALRESGKSDVRISVVSDGTLTNTSAASALVTAIKSGLASRVSTEILNPTEWASGAAGAINVTYHARRVAGTGYTDVLRVDFDLALSVKGDDRWHFKQTIDRNCSTDSGCEASIPDAMDDFGKLLAPEIGIGWSYVKPYSYNSGSGLNPYLLNPRGSLYNNPEFTRKLQEILERSKRRSAGNNNF